MTLAVVSTTSDKFRQRAAVAKYASLSYGVSSGCDKERWTPVYQAFRISRRTRAGDAERDYYLPRLPAFRFRVIHCMHKSRYLTIYIFSRRGATVRAGLRQRLEILAREEGAPVARLSGALPLLIARVMTPLVHSFI